MTIPYKPTFCPHCHADEIIRKGVRHNQHRNIPIYLCKACGRYFSQASISRVKYPPAIIVSALSYYNLGYSQSEVTRQLLKKHRIRVPRRTISLWIHRYQNVCTFARLRDAAMARYTPDTMILSETFEHRQAYTFKLHQAKLELLQDTLSRPQDFERLCEYLRTVAADRYPHHLFLSDGHESEEAAPVNRSSQTKLDLLPVVHIRKENLANDLAVLGLMRAKRNKERHEQIQEFMLINDSSPIVCEVPVYLTAEHVRYFRQAGFRLTLREEDTPITGHIDLVQVRQGYIHILDYKPDARKIQPVSQLTLYALALASHTKLPLKLFKCAWFDEKDYFEFYPLHCVYRKS